MHPRALGPCLLVALAACSPATPAATTADVTEGTGSSGVGSSGPSADTGEPWVCDPTTAAITRDVFVPACATMGCHGAPDPAAGLALADATMIEAQLVGVPSSCDGSVLVLAGDAAASLLLRKLEGDAGCGTAMPPTAALPAETIACVAAWIDALQPSCEQCGTAACVDVSSDADHCGGCNAPCPAGIACVDGACDCGGEDIVCGDSCVDPRSSPVHCGGCDMPCAVVCLDGACAADCGALSNCGGACVDTSIDANHCGGCDQPCVDGQACVDSSCVCDAPQPSFAADIAPLLASSCTGPACHAGAMPKAGLDLRATASWDALVGVAASQCGDRLRVAPGDPGASYLMDKLLGVELCSGTAMPKADQALPAEQLALLSAWICHGAAND